MKKYFNTQDKALAHLEYRKLCAYERIEKNKDEILGDASFVYRTNKEKWIVFIEIITQNMLKELEELQEMMEKSHPLMPFTYEEKIARRQNIIKRINSKFKTLDFEEYTINKQL